MHDVRSLLLVVLVACARDPLAALPTAQSTVRVLDISQQRPRPFDVLFVVDDSPAMAGFRETVIANAERFAAALSALPALDVHIGVVASSTRDGALHGAPAVGRGGDVIALWPFADRAAPLTNVAFGTVGDALGAMLDVGARGAAPQPLVAMKRALEAGFARDDAYLAIVLLAATDDTSPGDVADYAAWLHGAKLDPEDVVVAAVLAPAGGCTRGDAAASEARRLGQFLESFPGRSDTTSICQDDLGASLALLAMLEKTTLDLACLPATADARRCVASDQIEHEDIGAVVPCGDGRLPCFALASSPACSGDDSLALEIRRHVFPAAGDHLWLECELHPVE